MSETWLLFRVLFRNTMSLDLHSKKGKKGLALIVFLCLCFLPSLLMLYFSFLASFQALPLDTLYLEGGLLVPALLAAVMALFMIPTAFYFSQDIQVLLPLPVKPASIVLAKTGIVLLSQVSLGLLFAIPVFAAYFTVHPDLIRLLVALVVLATVAILPVSVVGILVIVLMKLVPGLRNKDRFNLIFGVLSVVLALGISMGSSMAAGSDQEMAELLTSPETLSVASIGFWQLAWAAKAVAQLSLSDLLLYLGATLLGLALFLETAKRLFLPAVTDVSGTTKKTRHRTSDKVHSPLVACMLAENRMLLRTPAWFMNCVLSSFLPAVVMIGLLFLQDVPAMLQELPIPPLTEWMAGIGAGSALLFGSVNCIASTAFSREGQNLWRMKAIPVPMEKQILGKGLLGMLWSAAATLPVLVFVIWLLQGSLLDLVLLSVGALVGSVLANGIGLLVDGWHPKLDWEDETAAVKNNFNGMIELFGSWLLTGILLIPLFVFGLFEHPGLYLAVVLGILVLIDVWMIWKGPALVARWLENKI